MEPTLLAGDRVIYDTASRVGVGDVAVFRGVVHRVVWFDPLGGVWDCGDRPNALPGRRPLSSVRGPVVAVARNGQWVELLPPPQTPVQVMVKIARAAAIAATWRGLRWLTELAGQRSNPQ
jgi:hypothetical protein